MIDSSGWEKRKTENQFPSFCVFVTLSLFFKIVKAFLIFLGIYQMVKTYSLWQKNKQTARQKTMINLFFITFKEFKGDVKDFFQPGLHRGGHGRQSGGEARGEHADQRVTTVMMMDMMMMMMMMVVVMVKIFNRWAPYKDC